MAKPKTKKPKNTLPVYTRSLSNGQINYMVDLGRDASGKRRWKTFRTKKEAELHAKRKWLERRNQGLKVFSIPEQIKLEASACVDRLKPHGATLTQAVDYYLAHAVRDKNAPTIRKIADEIIADKQAGGRRKPTIEELKYRFGDFCRAYGDRKLATLNLEELRVYFNNPALSARSRCHFMTKISMLYKYSVKRGWCGENLVQKLDRPLVEESEVKILSVEQAAKVLELAPKYGLLSWAVLGLFAGLRPEEIWRLDWTNVNLATKSIRVLGRKAKTRTSRIVEINETLAAWLSLCCRESGAVLADVPNRFKRQRDLVTEAAIEEWTPDCLRHSFVSYHLAEWRDEGRTASLAGHSPTMLYRHYRQVVSAQDAERFWAIRPGPNQNLFPAHYGAKP